MSKNIVVNIVLSFMLLPLHAQYSTISGKITDEKAQPLPYVTLQLTTPDTVFVQGASTDTLGMYKLTGMGPGHYLLVLSSVGYETLIHPFRMENKDFSLPALTLKSSSVALKEVEVKAQSFIRLEDRMMVIPEKQQVRHSYTGYDLLYNLMIPGLDVDRHGGKITSLNREVTLYIDGQKADFQEVKNLRPRDVEKVEYFEAPTGKYAMDQASINYITKKYTSGGYASADAKQTIGYLQGDYNASVKINKGNTAFTVWGGHNMKRYEGARSVSDETYTFPDRTIEKHSETTDGLQRSNRQYVQAKVNNRTDRRTMEAKFGFARNATPESRLQMQTRYTGAYNHEDQARSATEQTALSPNLNLYGNFKIKDNQSLEARLGGSYSNTVYERTYDENTFHSHTNVHEDYYRMSGSLNYVLQMKKQQTLSVRLNHSHFINAATYAGDYDRYTQYWSGTSTLYASYGAKIGKKLSLNIDAGLNSEMYRLMGQRFVQNLFPMGTIRLSYFINNNQMLMIYSSLNSVSPDFSWMNPVEQKVDSFMVKRGNPNQKILLMNNNILNYSLQAGNFNISAMGAFHYNSNAPFPHYFEENGKIVNSYSNDVKGKEVDAMLSLTWKATKNLHLNAKTTYIHLRTQGPISFRHNMWFAHLQANYYWKSLGISAFFRCPTHMMDMSSAHTIYNLDYGLTVNWSYRNFWIEAGTNAPFSKDLYTRNYFNLSPVYSYDKTIHDRTNQQTAWVKVAYNFDFGRKTKKDKDKMNTSIQSTILKAE